MLYKGLVALEVPVPDVAPGEPISLMTLRDLLFQIQKNRTKVDAIARTSLHRKAIVKRRLEILDAEYKTARAMYMDDGTMRDAGMSISAFKNRVEVMCSNTVSQIGMLRGRLAELEAAEKAIDMTARSLQQSKEVINAAMRAAMAEREGFDGD